MVCYNDSNTLVLGGFKFSKMHNRKKGIVVTSVDPDDTTKSVVVSCKENSSLNGSNHGNDDTRNRITKRNINKELKETELEANSLLFCRIVNKLLQSQNSSCFVGYEVIYEMVSSGLCKNRAQALALGKDLSKDLRLFYRVEFKRNTFSDDGKLYKFRPEVLLSTIMKTPMTIQKFSASEHDMELSPPSNDSNDSNSPTTYRKFAPKDDIEESKTEEITMEINTLTGKLKKKGRRPSKESIKVNDQTFMIPEDQSSCSEEDWGMPKNNSIYGSRRTMRSINEMGECSQHDDRSIYTEVTISEHNNLSAFRPIPTRSQYDDDDESYMDVTVSTGAGDSRRETHSYFDEYTLDDEDEYDTMSVPTTPVVKEKIKVPSKSKSLAEDFFSPNDVTGFDSCIVPTSRQSSRANPDSSLSSRMRRGELDIEIPYLDENDEDAFMLDEDM